MPDLNISTATIPPAPIAPAAEPLLPNVLRGFSTRLDPVGHPKRLQGPAKLQDDLRYLILMTLEDRALLKVVLTDADLGNVARLLQDEIENPDNWWPGQETPTTLSEIKITLRDITPIGGIDIVALEGDGDLLIRVGYVERATGVVVGVDSGEALIVPFGAYYRRNL